MRFSSARFVSPAAPLRQIAVFASSLNDGTEPRKMIVLGSDGHCRLPDTQASIVQPGSHTQKHSYTDSLVNEPPSSSR